MPSSDVTKVSRCSVVALRMLIGHYPAGLVFGSWLASRLLLGDVLDDLVFVPADGATTASKIFYCWMSPRRTPSDRGIVGIFPRYTTLRTPDLI